MDTFIFYPSCGCFSKTENFSSQLNKLPNENIGWKIGMTDILSCDMSNGKLKIRFVNNTDPVMFSPQKLETKSHFKIQIKIVLILFYFRP